MRVLLATLAQVLGELDTDANDTPTAEAESWIVDTVMPHVSQRIEQLTSKEYAPRLRTRSFHAYGDHIDDVFDALIIRGNPLLEVTTLTVGGTTFAADDYFFLDDDTPYWRVARATDAPASWSSFDTDWRNSIVLTGVWGYRTDYPLRGWTLSGQTVQNDPLTSSGTSITVTSASKFSPGQMLEIEDEWLVVTSVDNVSATKTLTVERGIRGTTAAAHDKLTAIHIWVPEPQITRAAMRWGAFLYRNRANFAVKKFDALGGTVIEQLPADAPQEVQNILTEFMSWHMAGGE